MKDPLFEAKLLRKDTGCVEYTGAKSNGYGRVKRSGKLLLAHRYAWELERGRIPDGMFVCHTCDNPPCCNIDHLFIGTNSDNMKDAYNKNRIVIPANGHKFTIGSRPSNRLLSEDAAISLVKEVMANTMRGGLVQIAKRHGVTYQLVRDISAGRSYISIAKALKGDTNTLDPGSNPGTSSSIQHNRG